MSAPFKGVEGCSFERGQSLTTEVGDTHSKGALFREGALIRTNTVNDFDDNVVS